MKKAVLPIIAAVIVCIAVVVIMIVPRGGSEQTAETDLQGEPAVQTSVSYADTDEDGNFFIPASGLSQDQVQFVRLSDDSKIELIARIGDDGTPKVALGTCQSCNGAPGAFYSQEGDIIQCNNCGLTFELGVIDAPGDGCHPISIDESLVSTDENGITLQADGILYYEELFADVAEH